MAIKINMPIDQGADYSTTINLADDNGDPLDLTGYSGNCQIRKIYSSNTYYTMNVETGSNTGMVTLSMTANVTANIPAGRYVYDVILRDSSSNTYSRIVEGIVTVYPQVTR